MGVRIVTRFRTEYGYRIHGSPARYLGRVQDSGHLFQCGDRLVTLSEAEAVGAIDDGRLEVIRGEPGSGINRSARGPAEVHPARRG